ELMTQVTTDEINAEMRFKQEQLQNARKQEQLQNVRNQLPPRIDQDVHVKWNPRGGVGVWANRAELEFRNVTFTPLITK
ncbi:MAG: hypothetical protein ABGY75_19185, partial [Gemmataceae bacterium]